MQLSEIRTVLKRYGFDESDPLDAWINEAKDRSSDHFDWPFFEKSATNNVAAGTSAFGALPTDYDIPISVHTLVNGNQTPLEYWDYEKFQREVESTTQSGNPSVWYVLGGQIFIWPVPDVATDVILVYRAQQPDLVAGTDVPDLFPTRFHYNFAVGAASIGLMAENEEDRAATALADFQGRLDQLVQTYSSKQRTSFATVQDVQGYGPTDGT